MTPPVDLWCPLSERAREGGRKGERDTRGPFIYVLITSGMCVQASSASCTRLLDA